MKPAARAYLQGQLESDPALRVAWGCTDTGGDYRVALMIRGVGECEIEIPRDKCGPLELPFVINRVIEETQTWARSAEE